jgi:hypothetical protein
LRGPKIPGGKNERNQQRKPEDAPLALGPEKNLQRHAEPSGEKSRAATKDSAGHRLVCSGIQDRAPASQDENVER